MPTTPFYSDYEMTIYKLPSTNSVKEFINKIINLDTATLTNNIKDIFHFSEFLYAVNGTIASGIEKLVEYALTEIMIETNDPKLEQTYREILIDKMEITKRMFKLGFDYFVYGNAFASVVTPYERKFIGKRTGKEYKLQITNRGPNWSFEGNELWIREDNISEPLEIKDISLKNTNFRLQIWNPHDIEINYNEYADQAEYYVAINKNFISRVKKDPFLLETTPEPILTAIMKGSRSVKLNKSNVIIFQRASPSGLFKGWGLPWLIHTFLDAHHYLLLQKTQDTILRERMIPYRFVFPPTELLTEGSPMAFDIRQWRQKVTEALTAWKLNPNNVQIFPVPLQVGTLSGEGKTLNMFGELDFANTQIIQSLQVPQEFIKGGLTWSGSSVSLRMLENHFLNYRERLEELLEKIVQKISLILNIPKVKVKLRPFKMADDLQRKQMMLNLAQMSAISMRTLLKEFELDYDKEIEQIKQEAKNNSEIQKEQMIAQAKAQIEAQAASMPNQELNIVQENMGLGPLANQIGMMQITPPPMNMHQVQQQSVPMEEPQQLPEQKPPRSVKSGI